MYSLLGGDDGQDSVPGFRNQLSSNGSKRTGKQTKAGVELDIASLTSSEAAALLSEKSSKEKSTVSSSRYRTNRVLAHHKFASELLAQEQTKHLSIKSVPSDSASDTDEDITTVTVSAQNRVDDKEKNKKNVARRALAAQVVQSRRLYSSSSSSEDDGCVRGRRIDTADSSNDESGNRRHQRVLNERPVELVRLVVSSNDSKISTKKISKGATDQAFAKDAKQVHMSARNLSEDTSAEDDNDSSSSGSESSSSDSDSDNHGKVIAKPLFVPRNRRILIHFAEEKHAQEDLFAQRETDFSKRRSIESRAILAKQMSSVHEAPEDDQIDEAAGAANSMPNDDDKDDQNEQKERKEAWELRELSRLLAASRIEEQKKKEVDEYERRRQMTDEQCLREDIDAGLYKAPGTDTLAAEKKGKGFNHSGAYYLGDR